jgi:hypothetical protein
VQIGSIARARVDSHKTGQTCTNGLTLPKEVAFHSRRLKRNEARSAILACDVIKWRPPDVKRGQCGASREQPGLVVLATFSAVTPGDAKAQQYPIQDIHYLCSFPLGS